MKTFIRIVVVALILAIIFVTMMIYFFAKDLAMAEGSYEEFVWVLCNPDSSVNIRSKPKRTSPDFGYAECGTLLKTNGDIKNGYLYVYDISAEETSGWISTRYVVWFEPVCINAQMRVKSQGRVACRKNIMGKIKSWARNGDILTVYWYSDEWSVTDRGYVMSQYLEPLSQ